MTVGCVYPRGILRRWKWGQSQRNENEQFGQMQMYSPLKEVCKRAADEGLGSP